MTKQDLIEKLVIHGKHRHLSKAAASDVIESLFDNLTLALKRGRRFNYPGFGTFLVKRRKERMGRNPQTGEAVKIPPFKTVAFRASAELKTKLN